jgi:type I restriction enzyme R subunit
LNDEVKVRSRHNLVQSRSFAEMLEKSVRRYQNRAIAAAQVIEELIELARTMREAEKRGENLGLTNTLKMIARELVEAVRRNVSIDWTVKESVQAKLRVIVRRTLRKYGYPPDKQESATNTVLDQAKLLSELWTDARV